MRGHIKKRYYRKINVRQQLREVDYFFRKDLIFVYLPLNILLILSIVSGILFKDIFLGISSDFFANDIFINSIHKKQHLIYNFELYSFFKKYVPLLLTFLFFIFFEYFNYFIKNNIKIYYFFKLKLYFDFCYNYLLINLNKISFTYIFKCIDKGMLEILGYNGLVRHFY